ncbi:c-type cytochrome biogenesis protein CcmI [Halomonas sp. MCCC 1A17488]|uniref:C-type cytochrome biogenesis protein CcmI n=1 Tax=Billgrantia sulfidoxydans TaxID=2733484 RepID=A0ABX7VYV0_9GAMM|nr:MULTISPECIES: c-type cytochrome biogenesis protein CcmI [Halomonas]MCE8017110.1 c-type cytochrome biogenesis protein CcmI [Halomonas sp. MCCC 1A17488]MCG3240443.1 c-type cytochrome biogenesis protein CcmI [Halomonas sp. MCCC 1A17488]QPP49695.1 c-type cytochrome biogenesis protein CcmI [Halomonas sp. SS10-MC5]QTP53305.1 c-type cytochrome biogenesis protein CcmI [Halomonas sulfidoxydans]
MNGLFLLLAMSLCGVALGFVLVPLLRAPRGERSESRWAINLAVHRDRVSELGQDLTTGTLTQARHDAALADLERELLDSGAITVDERPRGENHGLRRAPLVAACTSVALLPFMATGLYLTVGHADEVFATQSPGATIAEAEPLSEADRRREFEHLARQLQGRLAQDPADLKSWILLGRTLEFLGNLEAAERAFREAEAIRADLDQLDQAAGSPSAEASARRET